MNEATWLWIGAFGMLGGSAVLFLTGGKRTQDEEGHTIAHGLVPLFAAIAYCAMAAHQGQVTLSGGRVFLFARYLDWSVTTPVLLLGLSMTALHGAHRRAGLVAGVIAADIVMILTGLFFGASQDALMKWIWYITSCIAFIAVYYVLFVPMRNEARMRDPERHAAYDRNVVILSVLWLIYPIVVILGPDGLEIWTATLATACITVLDLTAKVVYGFISMAASKRITDADLARGEVSAAMVSTHSVPSGAPEPGPSVALGNVRQRERS
jgi:bacteriorhodopsin